MDYRYACVIDANSIYQDLVMLHWGRENPAQTQGWQVQGYTLAAGEQLLDAAPPVLRPHAGAAGFVSPRWDSGTSAWVEAATEEEIAAWEAAHPDPNARTLEEEKAARIAQSKADLDAYLLAHPLTWTDGNQYAITREKQQQLTAKILSATLAAQTATPYALTWNATGQACAPWTLENLAALAFAIDARVTALVSYQQAKEVAMQAAATAEALAAIEVDYDAVE